MATDRVRKDATTRKHSTVSARTLRILRDADPRHWDLLWVVTNTRIKNETGKTNQALYSATWSAMQSMYFEEDPERWNTLREKVMAEYIAETGWKDGRIHKGANDDRLHEGHAGEQHRGPGEADR